MARTARRVAVRTADLDGRRVHFDGVVPRRYRRRQGARPYLRPVRTGDVVVLRPRPLELVRRRTVVARSRTRSTGASPKSAYVSHGQTGARVVARYHARRVHTAARSRHRRAAVPRTDVRLGLPRTLRRRRGYRRREDRLACDSRGRGRRRQPTGRRDCGRHVAALDVVRIRLRPYTRRRRPFVSLAGVEQPQGRRPALRSRSRARVRYRVDAGRPGSIARRAYVGRGRSGSGSTRSTLHRSPASLGSRVPSKSTFARNGYPTAARGKPSSKASGRAKS